MGKRVHVGWTTGELRTLASLYVAGRPSRDELCAALPRHGIGSILTQANKHGLKRPRAEPLRWLRIAHQHFARREQGLLA